MTKKTTLKLLAFICLIGISIIWQSCQKEPDLVGKGDVNFNVLSDISKGLKCIACDMNHADKVIITVQYDDGSPTDYTQYQLDIHSMGGTFITKKIALPFGNYKVTEFYIIDALDNIIFASPLDGSVMAQNVENPLPILFSVDEKNISAVDIEVVCAINLEPEDFGLVQFPITEVETFQFLISVSELGTDKLLTANITVSSGNYSYQQVLVNNIVTVKDGYDKYIISINKEGYLGFIVTLTNSELKEYAKIPLIVELSLSSTFLDIFHHLDFNDIITTQYGPDAKLNLSGGGKYDWSALVNSVTNPLFIASYLIEKYGSNHIPILVGNHAYDWRDLNTNELFDCVLPVLLIPSNYFSNISDVAIGISQYQEKILHVRNWYKSKTGKSFRLAAPICVYDDKNSEYWKGNTWLEKFNAGGDRFDAWLTALNAYITGSHSPEINGCTNNVTILIIPFLGAAGNISDEWGAAGSVCYVYIPGEFLYSNVSAETSFYVIAHELGHAFGLDHAGASEPRVMDYYRNIPSWQYNLSEDEINTVLAQPAFN